jgi:predicted nucleotidyltransferase
MSASGTVDDYVERLSHASDHLTTEASVQSLIFELVGGNTHKVDQCGFTLLHAACIVGSEVLVCALIAVGANPLKKATKGNPLSSIDLVEEDLEKRGHLLPILMAAVEVENSKGVPPAPESAKPPGERFSADSSAGIETIMRGELQSICEKISTLYTAVSDEAAWKPQNQEHLATAAKIINLNIGSRKLDVQVAGSYAKGTAIGGKDADLDVAVVYPLVPGHYSAIHLARQVSVLCKKLAEYARDMGGEKVLCTARCVQFKLKISKKTYVDVDLLPAFDIKPYEFVLLRPETRELVQASVDHMQVEFVHRRVNKSPHCKALVHIAKMWRNQTAEMLLRLCYGADSEKKKRSYPRGLKLISYLIELVSVWAYENALEEEKANLPALFARFLSVLWDISSGYLHVFWTENYEEEIIPTERMLKSSSPGLPPPVVIVCPANPTNNVASTLRPQLWQHVCTLAAATRDILNLGEHLPVKAPQLSRQPTSSGSNPNWLLEIEKDFLKMQSSFVEAHMEQYHVVANSVDLQNRINKSLTSRKRVSGGMTGRLSDMNKSIERFKKVQFSAMENGLKKLDQEVPDHIKESNAQLADSLPKLRLLIQIADLLEEEAWQNFMKNIIRARTSATIGVYYLELGLETDGLNRIWEALSIPSASIGASLPPAGGVYKSIAQVIGKKMKDGEHDLKGLAVLLQWKRVGAGTLRWSGLKSDVVFLWNTFGQCRKTYEECFQCSDRSSEQDFFLLVYSEAALELARWEVKNEHVEEVLKRVEKLALSSETYKADWLYHWVHVLHITSSDDHKKARKCIDWLKSACPLHPHFQEMFLVPPKIIPNYDSQVKEILQILDSYKNWQGQEEVLSKWPTPKWIELLCMWESKLCPAEDHPISESAASPETTSTSNPDRASTSATGL